MSRPNKWTLGVLNDSDDNVPGTVVLISAPIVEIEPDTTEEKGGRPATLLISPEKRTPDGKVVLNPQPDDSPNDPLNWPAWRRNLALFALGIYCMIGGGLTPILAAGFSKISHTYHTPETQIALVVGFFMAGLGIGGVILSPTAIIFGKRPLYLVSAILLILTSIWCAAAPSFLALVFGRFFQGIATSAVEVLPSASITEIFFLHERAFKLGFYTMLLLSGKNLVPTVSALIIEKSGWRMVFWVVTGIIVAWFFVLFFFLPETFWDRTAPPKRNPEDILSKTQVIIEENLNKDNNDDNKEGTTEIDLAPNQFNADPTAFIVTDTKTVIENIELAEEQDMKSRSQLDLEAHLDNVKRNAYTEKHRQSPARSFLQTLRPYNGKIRQENWLKVAIRPFILFAYPAVLWSAMVYAFSVGWLIVLSEAIGNIYEGQAYGFNSLQVGLVYLSPFIGAVLGTAIAGKMSDIICTFMAKKNNGIFEPEFRLVMTPIIALSTTVGLMAFGWSAEIRDGWIVPTFFFGVIGFGCSLGSTTAITFVVDSYKEYSGEALVTLNFSKNIFHGLVFSLFFPHWMEKDGTRRVFIALGSIQMGCMLLSIPMFIFGKRARRWTAQANLMARF